MVPERENPRFDLIRFQARWREARGEGVPILPPVRPVFRDSVPLHLHPGHLVYKRLVKEIEEAQKRRWEPPPLFSHEL